MTTDIRASHEPATTPSWRRSLLTVPAVAGVAYTAVWVAGLSVSSSSTSVRTSGPKVLAAYAGHLAAATAQFVLTEGAAGVFLAVVVIAIGRAGLRAAGGWPARLTVGSGLAAAAISLLQCVLGVYLTTSVVSAGHAGTAGAVSDAISRLDGVKMLVLAVMAVAGVLLARRTAVLPRWLSATGVALAVAITASGIGYLLLLNSLALAAWISLPLLLVWVTGSGIALGRAGR
jgi:hypothetical protein